MAAEQMVMAQINNGSEFSQLITATGSKTFTLGKVTAAKAGGAMLTLTPTTGGSAIAVKLEGARQTAEMTSLVGKTVAISKPTMGAGAGLTNNWMIFQPVKLGAAKATASTATLFKLEGTRQGLQAASLTGQEFTVVKPLLANQATTSTLFLQPTAGGNIVALKTANAAPVAASMVGKTVTIGQAPMVAGGNQGTWLVLKSTAGATTAKAAGTVAAAKGSAVAMKTAVAPTLKMKAVAMGTTAAGASSMQTTGAASGQMVMAQVNGGSQLGQMITATGSNTFTLGKVTSAKAGAGMITLTPTGGGSAIAVKLEGARQAAEMSSLVGKTVAVSKPSVMAGVGAGNNWMIFQPVKMGAAKATASSATLFKLEGARQGMQAASLTGQKFIVVKPMMAGNAATSTLFLQPTAGGNIVALKTANAAPAAASMVGKTVTIGQAPIIAGGNQGSWLVLNTSKAVTATKAAGAAALTEGAAITGTKGAAITGATKGASAKAGAVAMKATIAPALKMQTVAMTTVGAGAGTMQRAAEVEGARAAMTKATMAKAGGVAKVGESVTVGKNAMVMMGAKLNEGVTVGKGSTIAKGAMLGDNVTIGKSVTIASKANIGNDVVMAKGVSIGEGAKIGSSSVIGKGSVIAKGAVVPKGAVIANGSTIMATSKAGTTAGVVAGKTATIGTGAGTATAGTATKAGVVCAKAAGAAKTGTMATKAVAGAGGAGAAAQAVAMTAQTGAGAQMMTVAATGGSAGSTAVAGVNATKGISLGLGLGLGIWGPIALGTLGAAAVYGYLKTRQVEEI